MSTGPYYPIHLPGNPDVDWINMPHKDAEIDRLRARIADLEAAGRLLGAECRVMRNDYPDENWPHVTAVRNATDSHPTAAGFVKEATDGH